jgi:hypothetical protein
VLENILSQCWFIDTPLLNQLLGVIITIDRCIVTISNPDMTDDR